MNLEENSTTTKKLIKDDVETLFFDTYAFYKIYEGSESYKKYEDCTIVTTKLNLFEIYVVILRNSGEGDAEEFFNNYYKFVRDFDENVIKNAAKLKLRLNKRDVSMTDCIGYSLAKQLEIKFLTGDKEFQDLENVEFVK